MSGVTGTLARSPVRIVPLSQLPSSAVAVCGAISWFTQVTVSPGRTRKRSG